jgi:hypothetical protein
VFGNGSASHLLVPLSWAWGNRGCRHRLRIFASGRTQSWRWAFFLSFAGFLALFALTGDNRRIHRSGFIALLSARALGLDVIPTGQLGIGAVAIILSHGACQPDIAVVCSALYILGRKSAHGAGDCILGINDFHCSGSRRNTSTVWPSRVVS